MMLTFFLAGIISFGEIREVFSRSLISDIDDFPISGYKEIDYRNIRRNHASRVYNNVLYFNDNQDELLDFQMQEYDVNTVETIHIALPSTDTTKNENEESYQFVNTRNTKQHRGKRYIHTHRTLCHFKICNLGRKRPI